MAEISEVPVLRGVKVVELTCGSPARRLAACWPTGALTSSRSSRRRATRSATSSARSATATCPCPASPSTTGASAPSPSTSTARRAWRPWRRCSPRPTSSSPTCGRTRWQRIGIGARAGARSATPASSSPRSPATAWRAPTRGLPGYDIGAFWARTGIARDMVPRNAAPVGVRGGLGDHFTGISACAGTLAALVERGRTGEGRHRRGVAHADRRLGARPPDRRPRTSSGASTRPRPARSPRRRWSTATRPATGRGSG